MANTAPVTTPVAAVLEASASRSNKTSPAPTNGPSSVPVPPRRTIITTMPDVVQCTTSSETTPWPTACSPPASPDSPAESTNATSICTRGL